MKNTQFIWIGVLGLIIVCIWQLSRIFELDNRISIEKEMKPTDIGKEYQQMMQTLDENRQYFARLKDAAIWQNSTDLMLWLTAQAKAVKVQIIGVEQLQIRQTDAFLESPVKLKVRGDYHSLGRFINSLERSNKPVKIIHLRIFSLKSKPGLTLYLVIAKVQTVGGIQVSHEKPLRLPASL